jgi:hypothetical protein
VPVDETAGSSLPPTALDIVADFFGGTAAPREHRSSAQLADGIDQSTSDFEEQSTDEDVNPNRLGLASYWLERWQSQHPSIYRPIWVWKCETPIRKLVQSDEPEERFWALATLLALGHDDHLSELIEQLTEETIGETLPWSEFVCWFPAEARAQWLRRHSIDWQDASDESWTEWEDAIVVDTPELADWIYDQIEHHDDEVALARMRKSLVHTFVGRDTAQSLRYRNSVDAKVTARARFSVTTGSWYRSPSKVATLTPSHRGLSSGVKTPLAERVIVVGTATPIPASRPTARASRSTASMADRSAATNASSPA